MTNAFSIRRNRKRLNEKRTDAFWGLMERMAKTQSLYEQAREQMTAAEFRAAAQGMLKTKERQLKKAHLYGRKLKVDGLIEDIPGLINRTRDEARALCPA
ncbi:Uncharacterised protein [uncultured archaeon]|nr:Uncharacterised protein [uncultured archaeon]